MSFELCSLCYPMFFWGTFPVTSLHVGLLPHCSWEDQMFLEHALSAIKFNQLCLKPNLILTCTQNYFNKLQTCSQICPKMRLTCSDPSLLPILLKDDWIPKYLDSYGMHPICSWHMQSIYTSSHGVSNFISLLWSVEQLHMKQIPIYGISDLLVLKLSFSKKNHFSLI